MIGRQKSISEDGRKMKKSSGKGDQEELLDDSNATRPVRDRLLFLSFLLG